MTQPPDVQTQLDRLTQEVQSLREERAARARLMRRIGAALVMTTLVVGVRTALAAGNCAQTLPAPLTTFCGNDPALAGEVNGNFQQLVTWVQQKVGTVGSANVTITGSETVCGKLTANSGLDVVGNTNFNGTTAVVGNQSVSGTSNLTVLNVSAVANVNGLTATGALRVSGFTVDGSANVCLGTYDCTSHTDSCGTGSCPAGKFVTSAVMPTSCAGSSNHSVTCCRLRLVNAVSGVCPCASVPVDEVAHHALLFELGAHLPLHPRRHRASAFSRVGLGSACVMTMYKRN